MKSFLHFLRGMAIGVAEVIPGVSGGTIAFITGIYEQLIHSIKSIDLGFAKSLMRLDFKSCWERVNGIFLLPLILGMVGGLIAGILIISRFLETHPPVVWGFFFGLILASAWYIMRRIEKADWKVFVFLLSGAVIAYYITQLMPAEGSDSLLFVAFSGGIAICALILPGISGSFILLLLGMYTLILSAARSFIEVRDMDSFLIMVAFSIGALIGLLSFARLVNYLIKNYRSTVFALLCGFMVGSLSKIWPWRDGALYMDPSGTLHKATIPLSSDWRLLLEVNKWPSEYSMGDPFTTATVVAMVVGFGVVLAFDYLPGMVRKGE